MTKAYFIVKDGPTAGRHPLSTQGLESHYTRGLELHRWCESRQLKYKIDFDLTYNIKTEKYEITFYDPTNGTMFALMWDDKIV